MKIEDLNYLGVGVIKLEDAESKKSPFLNNIFSKLEIKESSMMNYNNEKNIKK